MEDIYDLIDSVDSASNVESITYKKNPDSKWIIKYKSDLPDDEIDTENLNDFLNNG